MFKKIFLPLLLVFGGFLFADTALGQNCEENEVLFVLATEAWGEEISWEIVDSENNIVASGSDYTSYSASTEILCLADGCYSLLMYDSFGDGWNGALATVIFGDEVLAIGDLPQGDFGVTEFGVNNPDCAPVVVLGCTDPSAINYNPDANFDDGSCEYDCECPDVWAPVCAFDFETQEYVTYSNECEAICDGNTWIINEGTCEDPIIPGCTDPEATNYNPQATEDDGSCEYPVECEEGEVLAQLYVCTFSNGNEVSLSITDEEGNVIFSQDGYNAIEYFDICLSETGCYTVYMSNNAGNTGWYGGYYWINVNGFQVSTNELDDDANDETAVFSLDGSCGEVYGCTDPEAENYDPDATEDDGSCEYSCDCPDVWAPVCAYDYQVGDYVTFANECEAICAGAWINYEGECGNPIVYGCTDPEALNYNPEATDDDDSCIYESDCAGNLLFIYMYDSFGDGWNGSELIITSGDSIVYTATFNNGDYAEAFACLDDGCYGLEVSGGTFPGEVSWTIVGAGGTWSGGAPSSVVLNLNGDCTAGCTDPAALNYDPNASVDDGSCEYECECTDEYAPVCAMDPNTQEFITYSNACEAECDGAIIFWDYPCDEQPVYGCTDPDADNYDPNATEDDGSCVYPFECDANVGVLVLYTESWGNEVSWQITGADSLYVAAGNGYQNNSTYVLDICFEDGCYLFEAFDSFGDGWNGGYATLEVGGAFYTFGLETGNYAAYGFGVNDEDCTYEVEGCTDPEALNYNPFATTDDGSCEYPFACENGIAGIIYTCTFGNGSDVAYDIIDENGVVVYSANDLGNNVIMNEDICLEEGMCYTVEMTNLSGNTGWYGGYFWINIDGVQVTTEFLDADLTDESYTFSIDGTACPYGGCTDPEADNYDENADYDDGSCEYSEPCEDNNVYVTLTTQVWGGEVAWSLVNEEGDVVFEANEFDSDAFYDWDLCLPAGCYTFVLTDSFGDGWNGAIMVVFVDGIATTLTLDSGDYAEFVIGVATDGCEQNNDIYGCTDPDALNYNPIATVDDGSCEYEVDDCETNAVSLYIFTQAWGTEISWDLTDGDGNVVATGGDYSSWSEYEVNLCLEDGCYALQMYDSWGDGWNGGYYMFIGENGFVAEGTLLYGNDALDMIGINSTCEVDGCTDEEAINYNPNATIDDGSCVYNNGFDGIDLEDLFGVEILVNLAPNPVVDEFVINLEGLQQDQVVTLRVMNMMGQLIDDRQFTAPAEVHRLEMNASDWANGTYFVSVVQGSNVKSVPLIIAK